MDGLLVVDKPEGLTSHDVVARVRRLAGTRRVGHTGTLDPMATGVLVLCLGKATRLVPYIEEMGGPDTKEYEAHIRFGFETTTDDAEGAPRAPQAAFVTLAPEQVRAALAAFVGEIDQVPPAFSAKKVAGERAYAIARRGEEVDVKPARIHVGAAELLALEGDIARVRFLCSRGTYIRALARDVGRALGVGAHLVGLRRTRSGVASLDRAVPLSSLTAETLTAALIPMMFVLESWPAITVGELEVVDLRLGRGVSPGKRGGAPLGRVRVGDGLGRLVALADWDGSRLQPFCVF